MFQYCQASARWGPDTTILPPPSLIKDAVLALDRRFTIIGCDATAPSLFGHERRRLVGSHVSTLIPDIAWPSQFIQESAEERWGHLRFSRLGFEACHADGSRFPVTASLLQDADGNLLLRVRRLEAWKPESTCVLPACDRGTLGIPARFTVTFALPATAVPRNVAAVVKPAQSLGPSDRSWVTLCRVTSTTRSRISADQSADWWNRRTQPCRYDLAKKTVTVV